MPQIFRIGSYIVYIWSDEGLPTEPIHVHVIKGNVHAKFTICPVIMVENHGLKPSEVKLIMRIIADNEEIIAEHWNKFFNNTDKL